MNESNIIGIFFSKDRAFQLEAALRSFFNKNGDSSIETAVLYAASDKRYKSQYETLAAEYAERENVKFVEEIDFYSDLIALVAPYDYVLFAVDDAVFVEQFSPLECAELLREEGAAIGFSLRLGKNTNYCYPLDSAQPLPEFMRFAPGVLKYKWTDASYDFGYPLELSGSLYRCEDVFDLLADGDFENPNSLESHLAESAALFKASKPFLLCPERSVAFCVPFNKVQDVAKANRDSGKTEYSPEAFADLFDEGARFDVDAYAGFTPNACHMEVDLKLVKSAKKPIVSVVIPCYNQDEYLAEAVESVVAQTFNKWECIIVNDGSPDNTSVVAQGLIEKYSDKNISLIEKSNGGLSDARNAGISASRGKYILPLDADDKIKPDYLEKAVRALDENHDFSIVYVDEERFGDESGVHRKGESTLKNLFIANVHDYCSLYRREVWESCGGYSPAMFLGGEDWNFWIAAAKRDFKSLHIKEPLFMYRVRKNSMVAETSAKINEVKAHIVTHHPEIFSQETRAKADKIIKKSPADSKDKLRKIYEKHPDNQILEIMSDVADSSDSLALVSVVIPTRNRRGMLQNALESVAGQTYKNIEIIVVNDAGEEVSDIVELFEKRANVKYVAHDINRGLSAARNTGISNSSGKYLCFLDDDDVFYDNHVETLVDFLENYEYKIAYTNAERGSLKRDGSTYYEDSVDLPFDVDFDRDALLVANITPVLCVMVERECFDEAGLFDENLSTHEDWDMWIRLSINWDFAHIRKTTCKFTSRDDGETMTSGQRADMLRTYLKIYEKTEDLAKDLKHVLIEREKKIEILKRDLAALERGAKPVESEADSPINGEYKVSIIICAMNNFSFTRNCVEAVRATSPEDVYELIVVDNGSSDETPEFLMEQSKKIKGFRHIRNEKNLGFAKGNNQGIEASDSEYILLLNNDTIPLEGWLDALIDKMDSNAEIGAAGACLLYPDNDLIQHAWVAIGKENGYIAPYHAYRYYSLDEAPKARQDRFAGAVTGACMIVRRSALEKTGALDENYVNGLEDIDLCFRLRHEGYKIAYCSQSRLYHYESATPNRHDKDVENWRRLNELWLGVVPFDETASQTAERLAKIREKEEEILNRYNENEDFYENSIFGEIIEKADAEILDDEPGKIAPEFSIIIPVHNQVEFTRQCVEGILETKGDRNIEIIVVDNASTDETADYLASLGDAVKTARNDENVSYSKANNQGAEIAFGDFLIFLNNDTKPFPGWLDALFEEFAERPETAVQGAKLLYPDNKIQHAGMVFGSRLGLPEEPYHAYLAADPSLPLVNRRRRVQFVTGACMAVRAEVFADAGGFDEGYVFGWEDTDFCMKINQTGKKIIYNPKAALYHYESTTKRIVSIDGERLDVRETARERRNRERFFSKWNDRVVRDADDFYAEDGLAIEGGKLVAMRKSPSKESEAKPENKHMRLTSFSAEFWDVDYSKIKTVLVKVAAAIGDALGMTAVVNNLKKTRPNLKIYVSGVDFVERIFRHNEDIAGFAPFGSDEEARIEAFADRVVDYNGLMSRAPEYYNGIPYMDVLGNFCGVKLQSKDPVYYVEDQEVEFADSVAAKFPAGSRIIGVQFETAKDLKRSYPRGAELINELLKDNPEMRFVNFGKEPLKNKNASVYDCADTGISLGEQIALAGKCDAFITIDSAFFHVGHNLYKKPTLVIVGLTNPFLIGNAEAGFAFVRNERLDCLECYWQKECDIECMKELEPSHISEVFQELILNA